MGLGTCSLFLFKGYFMVFPIRAFFPNLPCTKSCSNSCFFSPVCRAPNRAPICVFFPGLPCTKSRSNLCFFSRFAVHQIVLQFVFFFPVCRAPNRAPIRAFFPGLACAKSCSNSCFFSRFAVHQIVLQFVLFSRFAVHQIVLQFVFFFPVCRAPNRAPIRAFFPTWASSPGLSFVVAGLVCVFVNLCLRFRWCHT